VELFQARLRAKPFRMLVGIPIGLPKPWTDLISVNQRASAMIRVMFLTTTTTSARTNAQLHTGPTRWLSPRIRFLKRSSPS
jgi:hypothetical protein